MKEKPKSTPRRSPGEANYRKRADGSWEGRITYNYKPYSVYGKSRGECKTKIDLLKEKLCLGVDTSTPSLAEWMQLWLDDYVAVDRKPSTAENYESVMKNHVLPELGRIRVDRLAPSDVQRLIGKLRKKGYSARYIRGIHHVLRCSLNVAVARKMIAVNPAAGAVVPKLQHVDMDTISATDVTKLQEADLFESEPLFACVLLMLFTGLRRGEALALRWSDIDLEHNTLVVQRELVKVQGGTVFQSTKTRTSNRLIPFGAWMKSVLKKHHESQSDFIKKTKGYKHNDLVFARESGNPYYPDSLRKILHRILKKAGLHAVRVHDLRHTCATILMLSGVHPKVVQEILGHSNISVTLGTYSHTMPSMKKDAVEIFDNFLVTSKKKDPAQQPAKSDEPALANNAVAMEEKVLRLPENIIKLVDLPFDQTDPSKLN